MRRPLRRTVPTALLCLALVPALVGLPVLSLPAAAAHPVAAQLTTLALAGVDPAALAADRTALAGSGRTVAAAVGAGAGVDATPEVLTAPRLTGRFDLLAVTWDGAGGAGSGSGEAAVQVQVRVREEGSWTGWQVLAPDADGPDAGTAESAAQTRGGVTEPLLTGGADGVQVRVDSASGRVPAGLRLTLVDGGRSDADAPSDPPSTAAADARPPVVTRSQWGADERLTRGEPEVNGSVKALVLHHTATTNSYSRAQAYAQVRSVLAFHTRVRGWNDIGYNVLVDRYGRVYEGRRGSLSQAVRGAHAGGFNSETVGVSVLGTFSTQAPPRAAVRAVGDVLGWKSAQHFIDPRAETVLTSQGGGTARYDAGVRVRVRTVSGHRDVGLTECPGNDLYPLMSRLRTAAAAPLVPGLTAPALSRRSTLHAGDPVSVTAGVPTTQRWTLSVTPLCGGTAVRRMTGTADARIAATWNLRDGSGRPVAPGIYRMTLATRSPIRSVPVWEREVEVLPPVLSGTAAREPARSACAVQRVAGGSSLAVAVSLGRRSYPASTSIVLARGRLLGDGAVAAPLARVKGAPLLFTGATALPALVVDDIVRRKVTTAWVVGSPAAVHDTVLAQLRSLGVHTVVRLSGGDRYGTAAVVAREIGATSGSSLLRGAVLLNGEGGRQDALPAATVAAAAAAAAASGRPMLWVTSRTVPGATATALRTLGITSAAVVAPASLVSGAVLSRLAAAGVAPVRVAGTDPVTASVAALAAVGVTPASAGGGGAGAGALVASASDAAASDVLAGASTGRPVLLTYRTTVPAPTLTWLRAARPSSTAVLGGLGAVDTSVLRALWKESR